MSKNIFQNFFDKKKNKFSIEYHTILKNQKFKKKITKKKEFIKTTEKIINNLKNYIKINKFILILDNSLDLINILFALLLLGKKIIIINPKETYEIKTKIIQDNLDAVIITKNRFKINSFKKKNISSEFLFKKENLKKKSYLSKIIKNVNYDNLRLSYCSSGTTSLPKLIHLDKVNIFSQIEQINERLKIKLLLNKFFTAMPCTHISAFFFIVLNGIFFDKKVILINNFIVTKFIKILRKEKLSLIYVNPSMIDVLNNFIKKKLDLKRTFVICGSAPLSKTSLRKFIKKTNCKFIHLYGLTETTNTACVTPVNKNKKFYKNLYFSESIPGVGNPLKNCNIKILKNNKITSREKITGEILISGPNVINRKKNKEFFSSKNFKSNFLKTGDIGFLKKINNVNCVFLTGRKKEMIIKNGINIYLNEIDNFFKNQGKFKTHAVKKLSRFSGEDYDLVTDDPKEFKNNLKKYLDKLPDYMRPNSFILVKKIYRTFSGKIKKNKISSNLSSKEKNKYIIKSKLI